MLDDSIRNMKLDRRLARRRGWISDADLEGSLEALPDVAEKGSHGDDEGPAPVASAATADPAAG